MRTYFLYLDTQPADPVKEADVRRVVEKACRHLEKLAPGLINFEEPLDKMDLEHSAYPILTFRFRPFSNDDTAQWRRVRAEVPVIYEVAFNARYAWAARWWHPFIGRNQDLYTHCLQELLHIIGLYPRLPSGAAYHNPDPGSVMHSNPRFPHLTETDLGQLRYLLTTKP